MNISFAMEEVLSECAAFGIDLFLFGICYRLYRNKSKSAKVVMEAPSLEIDSSLFSKVKVAGNSLPYAVVSGVVRSTTTALRSQYIPNVKGVIRSKITKERKLRWSPILRIWSTVEQVMHKSEDSVPFVLVGSGRWFKSSIEVIDPLNGEELNLTTVYDQFTSHEDSIGDVVAGWFRGEHTAGIQEIETMLTEGTSLTGVGELVIENDVIKLKPPADKLTYFLTTMSHDSLIRKLQEAANFYKVLSVLLGCVGAYLLSAIIFKLYRARKLKLEAAKQREQRQVASRRRRLADPLRGTEISRNDRTPLCIVCLTNPVEIVILECGHTCLCLECGEHVQNLCPVCRSPIERTVPAYLP